VRIPVGGSQFRRDVKLAQKRGKDMSKLREAIMLLTGGGPLPVRFRDHALTGEWKQFRDCHTAPDWLLLYLSLIESTAITCISPGLEYTPICSERRYGERPEGCPASPCPASPSQWSAPEVYTGLACFY
jgi:mRNA interferase YafQ